MRFVHPSLLLAPLALSALGCGDLLTHYGPPGECVVDSGTCGSGSAGGGGLDGGPPGKDAGTDGSAGTSELTGAVQILQDPDFLTTSPASFTGAASIIIQPATGAQIVVPYGGTSGPTFDAMGVPAGQAWVLVQDQTQGGSGIWSTVTPLAVPQLGPVALPVVDSQFFSALATNLLTQQAQGLSTGAAHIVLVLRQTVGGQSVPYKGLQVSSGLAGATVVYDVGPGSYSDTATATGTGGTILLFNTGAAGMTTISLTDTTATQTVPPVTVYAAQGAVTIAAFEL